MCRRGTFAFLPSVLRLNRLHQHAKESRAREFKLSSGREGPHNIIHAISEALKASPYNHQHSLSMAFAVHAKRVRQPSCGSSLCTCDDLQWKREYRTYLFGSSNVSLCLLIAPAVLRRLRLAFIADIQRIFNTKYNSYLRAVPENVVGACLIHHVRLSNRVRVSVSPFPLKILDSSRLGRKGCSEWS